MHTLTGNDAATLTPSVRQHQEQLVEAYQGRGVFVADHPAAAGGSPANGRQDPAIRSMREDLDQLAERVARIERILADSSGAEADPP